MSKTDKTKAALLELLGNPRAYYTPLAEISGGVTSGVFLSQLFYWTGKGSNPDGWIYKTRQEWRRETGLTRREQETARKRLRERGIIQEKLAGVPATLHYRLNLDAVIDLVAGLRPTSWALSAQLVGTKAPNRKGANRPTGKADSAQLLHRLPESTAESETETAAGPSAWCSIHNAPMELRHKDGQSWYSHRLPGGGWCRGAPNDGKPKPAHTTATCPMCYIVKPIEHMCPDCGHCLACCECNGKDGKHHGQEAG